MRRTRLASARASDQAMPRTSAGFQDGTSLNQVENVDHIQ